MRRLNMLKNFKLRRSRAGGNPVAYVAKSLDPRLRGDDDSTYLVAASIFTSKFRLSGEQPQGLRRAGIQPIVRSMSYEGLDPGLRRDDGFLEVPY